MKFILGFLFILQLIFSSSSFAENLCAANLDIPEDFRIPESHLNEENAESAIALLTEIVINNKNSGEWFAVPNALKVIDGYIRRRDALNYGRKIDIESFCDFMKTEGWFYD